MRIFQLPDVNGTVQFVHAVAVLLIRVEHHVTRASAFNGGHFRRFMRGEESIIAEGKQANTILFQRWDPQGAVVGRNIGRVAPFQPFHNGHRFTRQAIDQRSNAHAAGVIGRAEDKTALMIGRNMRRAARQRRFASESQRAVIGRNAVSQTRNSGRTPT